MINKKNTKLKKLKNMQNKRLQKNNIIYFCKNIISQNMKKFSIIIPVYNRPNEINELLHSLNQQVTNNFEIIIIEDGSKDDCKKIVEKFSKKLQIKYFFKKNSGPAKTRNYGAKYSEAEYLIFFDSDCIIPDDYFTIVSKELENNKIDAWGGPDAAHESFSNLQKAINYSMTSFFTTGNIRGDEKIARFYPRSFNMGIKKTVFDKIGGFPMTNMFPGEDMVFAIEIIKQEYITKLFKKAKVFHKRRNTIKTFFKQVFGFGKTRHIISRVYPETFKIFFLAPTVFVIGVIFLFISTIICQYAILPISLYILIIFIDSLRKNKFNFTVAFLSIITSFVQLFAYGIGFLSVLFKGDTYGVFKEGFYLKKNNTNH